MVGPQFILEPHTLQGTFYARPHPSQFFFVLRLDPAAGAFDLTVSLSGR